MVAVLGILLAVVAIAAVFLGLQVGGARAQASRAARELASTGERLGRLEADAKKSAESLDAKRRENDELKERLKDVKRRRHEEQEATRLKKDLQEIREEVEREMEKKLAQAREEAEASKAAVKKLTAEVEVLKARRPAPPPAPPPQEQKLEEKPAEERLPLAARPLKDEERARLDAAEKGLAKSKARIEELEAEVKRFKGRTETDRRVFIVQKGELDLARDRFRALESRFNEAVLERDELAKQVWTLDQQMKALRPTAEPAQAPRPEEPRPAAAAPEVAAPPAAEPVVAAVHAEPEAKA